ncbi:MAG: DNA alkylation repair protein [Acholeplasmatales bacterium]|nr:DNA alkylation repair protein [Acholeplasmatales bacterium]
MNLTRSHWDGPSLAEFRIYLASLADAKNANFSQKIFNSPHHPILGLKTSLLKDLVKQVGSGNYLSFLAYCSYDYFEEVSINLNLWSKINDLNQLVAMIAAHADSWALIDGLKFDFIKTSPQEFFEPLKKLFVHPNVWVTRFSILCFMRYYLTSDYLPPIINLMLDHPSQEYYINMALAWFLQVVFLKSRDDYFNYITSPKAKAWVVNKSISKIRDSLQVPQEQKDQLRFFRITKAQQLH